MIACLIAAQLMTVIALVATLRQLSQSRAQTRAALAKTVAFDVPPSPELKALFESGSGHVITIEVLNPLELAATKAKFAGKLAGALAPSLIRGVVNRQAAAIIKRQLPVEGVLAEVAIRNA